MKKMFLLTAIAAVVLMAAAGLAWGSGATERVIRPWRIPVVMEAATLRGKVVILETRRDERTSAKNLPIEVWSQAQGTAGQTGPGRRIHAGKTDDDGLFALPLMETGQYFLVVGKIYLRLTVVPPAPIREGQQEPKILFLILPKEVL